MKKTGVALLGLGTVGGGAYRILRERHDKMLEENGIDIEVRHVIERDMAKVADLGVDPNIVSQDIDDVANDKDTSIVAEFFGGIEPARTFLIKCLLSGKSIVTANKEMFAKCWPDLEEAAKKGGAGLYFEASCVGGVPIIRALRQSMQGNDILSLKGIVNGTTNYILSKMSDDGLDYSEALSDAQRLGYAEANPSADVDGFDSMYKLSILSSLAFRAKVPISQIYREGISRVTKTDIALGKEFGYALKLLAIAKRGATGRIEARVHPAFIPASHPLAAVKESFNAVFIVGNNVGDIMLYGRGAGDLPTGSAIVSDIAFAANRTEHQYAPFRNSDDVDPSDFTHNFACAFYIRLTVKDRAGALAQISAAFATHNVNLRLVRQFGSGETATVVFFTHETLEKSMSAAIDEIRGFECLTSVDAIIRVEE